MLAVFCDRLAKVAHRAGPTVLSSTGSVMYSSRVAQRPLQHQSSCATPHARAECSFCNADSAVGCRSWPQVQQ